MQHVQSWPTDPSNDVGGELAPGWHVEVKTRNSGTSAGTSDAVSLGTCHKCIVSIFLLSQSSISMLLCMTAKPCAAASGVPPHFGART